MQCTNSLYHKQLQQQLTRAPQQPQHLAALASSIQCCFRSAPGRQALFRNLHHVLRPQLATCSSSGDPQLLPSLHHLLLQLQLP